MIRKIRIFGPKVMAVVAALAYSGALALTLYAVFASPQGELFFALFIWTAALAILGVAASGVAMTFWMTAYDIAEYDARHERPADALSTHPRPATPNHP